MTLQGENSGDPSGRTGKIKKIWFPVVTILYGIVFLIFGYLNVDNTRVLAGLVIGGIFPLIAFIYFHRHCKEGKKNISSILNWVVPAFCLHLVIILSAWLVLIQPKTVGFKGSLLSSSYRYGKLFKSFQKTGLGDPSADLFSNDAEREKKIKNAILLYGSHFDEMDENSNRNVSNEMDGVSFEEMSKFTTIATKIDKIPFYISLTFGIMGALLFCLSDAISRFNNADLYPKIYIFYIARFVVSAGLAIALSPLKMDELPVILVALIFFSVGYFPERAIKYIDEKFSQYLGVKSGYYKPIPLGAIEGLSPEVSFRFRQNGIMDVQHLALADIGVLEDNLPYSRNMLLDWIDQAILRLRFPDEIELLKKFEIRTALDLDSYDPSEGKINNLVKINKVTEAEKEHVDYLHHVIRLPHINERLKTLVRTADL